MKALKAEVMASPGHCLGEGPFTVAKDIYWFDILGEKVFFAEADQFCIEELSVVGFVCCAGTTEDGNIIAAGSDGISVYDTCFRLKKRLFEPPFDRSKLRFNDGKVGPDGAFWVGSMSCDGGKPVGALYRVTDHIEKIIEGMLIPNGLGWSPDETIMYITDTGKSMISRWKFDRKTGCISDEKLFISSEDMKGDPDGLTVDSTGNVWSAFWGGGCVCGFSPNGEMMAKIKLEAKNPTSCCFYGEDYSGLFITSATEGLSNPGPADGSVFRANTGTKGQAPFLFRYY